MAKINITPEVVIRELQKVYNDYRYKLDFYADEHEYQQMAEIISQELKKDKLTFDDFFNEAVIGFVGALVLMDDDSLTEEEKVKLRVLLYASADEIKIAKERFGFNPEYEIRNRLFDILKDNEDMMNKESIFMLADILYDPEMYPNVIGRFTPSENNAKN